MLAQTMPFTCLQKKGQWRRLIECWTQGQILWGMSYYVIPLRGKLVEFLNVLWLSYFMLTSSCIGSKS